VIDVGANIIIGVLFGLWNWLPQFDMSLALPTGRTQMF